MLGEVGAAERCEGAVCTVFNVHLCVCGEMICEVGEAERCEDAVCTVYSVHLCV